MWDYYYLELRLIPMYVIALMALVAGVLLLTSERILGLLCVVLSIALALILLFCPYYETGDNSIYIKQLTAEQFCSILDLESRYDGVHSIQIIDFVQDNDMYKDVELNFIVRRSSLDKISKIREFGVEYWEGKEDYRKFVFENENCDFPIGSGRILVE